MYLLMLQPSSLKSIARTAFILGLSSLMIACSPSSDVNDLQQFIVEVSLRPGGVVEPLPEIVPYEAYTYSAASLRSPFDIPIMAGTGVASEPSQQVQPDLERKQEALEEYNLANISMVGMMRRQNVFIALVRDENGKVHRVARGNYMGRNYGRVVDISPSEVELIEIVPAGDGGWVERPRTLVLQTK